MSKKIPPALKARFQEPVETVRLRVREHEASYQKATNYMNAILKFVQEKKILIKPTKKEESVATEEAGPAPSKKKNLQQANCTIAKPEEKAQAEDSDAVSQEDFDSSTSSKRTRRAAAQVADKKVAILQSLNMQQKLRRPTGFDEKGSDIEVNLSVPPTKSRRTRKKQLAGSTSSTITSIDNEVEIQLRNEVQLSADKESRVLKQCTVSVECMTSPYVNERLQGKRKSRSEDRTSGIGKRSRDLFNESINLLSETQSPMKGTNLSAKVRLGNSDVLADKLNTSKISPIPKKKKNSIGININNKSHTFTAIAQISPVRSLDGLEFQGFSEPVVFKSEVVQINPKTEPKSASGNGDSIKEKEVQSKHDSPKENIHSQTRRLRSGAVSNESSEEESVPRSRTKTIRKAAQPDNNNLDKYLASEFKEPTSVGNITFSSECSEEENVPRSRTKTLRKAAHPDNNTLDRYLASEFKEPTSVANRIVSSESSEEENVPRSRTKTIRKAAHPDSKNLDKNVASEFKEPSVANNKKNGSGTTKGELVKKRFEDFENLKKTDGEKTTEREESVERNKRVTRNAAARMKEDLKPCDKQPRGKVKLAAVCVGKKALRASVKAKKTRRRAEKENVSSNKLLSSATKIPTFQRVTPLGPNNRNTPSSKIQSAYSVATSVDSTAVIQKQDPDDVLKKKRDDERKKCQLKEEEAKKKKEEHLKMASEETRRKREEKLTKVAAAREAAEKEKALLAAKAEKEKEQKQRQIAADKERQHKEERLKKKLLMQQKTLETEERRKQEEAARLAKLKEQEEEHKRVLAMKEREQANKPSKTAEQRLAESEKAKKIQPTNLAKYAAINSATQKGVNTAGIAPPPPPQSYELTPPREDRQPLPPKTETDYGIDDANSEDSSDDESLPKKTIPQWAQSKNRQYLLGVTHYLPIEIWDHFMENDKHPDEKKMFPQMKKRVRTSSAVWNTPPSFK